MTSCHITSCQIGENVETVTDYFLGPQYHCEWWLQDCSNEIKRLLLLGRKAMTKSRDIILPTNIHIVKAVVFSVVMYRCESWSIKKAECQRIDAFELWYWTLWVPPTARRSKQSILKEINPEYSLEGLMMKLKL